MKFLLLLLIVALAWWLLRHPRPPQRRAAPPRSQDMVACHHCGLHVPRDEAIGHQGRSFCCPEHARQHRDP